MTEAAPFKYRIVHGLVTPPICGAIISQQRMEDLKNFHLEEDDVFVVTYPKSGTTWLQQITRLIRNEGEEDGQSVVDSVPWLEALNHDNRLPSLRVFKSHSSYDMMPGGLPHTTPAKYIYAARNPKDVAVSMYYHTRGFKQFKYNGCWNDFFQLFLSGRIGAGLWFDHVLDWWKRKDEENVLFLKYEDMKRDLPETVRIVADFMGHSLKPEVVDKIVERSTFESMKANPDTNYSFWAEHHNTDTPQFMRKGIVGDWKSHFTPEQNIKFDKVYAEKLKGSGLEFDFGD